MPEVSELLPCPFCNEQPNAFPSGDGTGTMIECLTPGCVNPHVSYYGEGEAAKRWNHRTRPKPVALDEAGAREVLAERGRFPSGGAVPFDVCLSAMLAFATRVADDRIAQAVEGER